MSKKFTSDKITSFSHDGRQYDADEAGVFTVDDVDSDAALAVGLVPVAEKADDKGSKKKAAE